MDFRKKLKIRLFTAISYIIIGVALGIVFNIINTENNFLSSFGFALVIIGIVYVRKYLLITKNEDTIKKRQIIESDERNISIANKAKSVAFSTYFFLACVAIIVLEILNKTQMAMMLSGTVGVLTLIYWISYFIIGKKS